MCLPLQPAKKGNAMLLKAGKKSLNKVCKSRIHFYLCSPAKQVTKSYLNNGKKLKIKF